MPFSSRTSEVGVTAGPEHGLQRLIVQVQPVAPEEIGHIHRHDGADQILCVLQGEVLIEVDGQSMVCRPGEMGVVPAGSPHGFVGLATPALLEVFGEQAAGTVFLLADNEEIEVHRPGVPWDRHGPPTDMAALASRLLAPALPTHPRRKPSD
jgi:quercetin dioxygenase-like cupin family protein